MKRLRQGRWLQLAFALWMLGAMGVFAVRVTRSLPPVPHVTIHPGYSASMVLFTPNCKRLVTAANSRRDDVPTTVDIWDVESGALRCSLDEIDIKQAELSSDGRSLLVIHSNSYVTLWDLTIGEKIARLNPETKKNDFDPSEWRFSPDGRFVLMPAADEKGHLIEVIFWEVATRKERARISGSVEVMQFAADGKRLTMCLEKEKGQRVIQQWEITADGEIGLSMERRVNDPVVGVSPDLQTFITRKDYPPFSDSDFQLWELSTGQEKTQPVRVSEGFLWPAELSPRGRFLIAPLGHTSLSYGEYVVLDASNGLEKVGLFSDRLQISPRERWIVVSDHDGSEVWDASGRCKHLVAHRTNDYATLSESGATSVKVRFSPDDRWLFTSGLTATESINPVEAILTGQWNNINGTVSDPVSRLWDVERREEIATFSESKIAVFSPDSRTLLIQDDQNRLRLYALPPRQVGVPLALTVATWGSMLLLCWAVKRRRAKSPVIPRPDPGQQRAPCG